MNRKLSIIELAELVAAKAQTTNRMSELFLKELFATVSQELTEGRGVEIKGLGSFVMPTAMTDDDEAVIEFAPAQSVADAVNQPFAQFEPMELSDDLTPEQLMQLTEIEPAPEQAHEAAPEEMTEEPPVELPEEAPVAMPEEIPAEPPVEAPVEEELPEEVPPVISEEVPPLMPMKAAQETEKPTELPEPAAPIEEPSEPSENSENSEPSESAVSQDFETEKRKVAKSSLLKGIVVGALGALLLTSLLWILFGPNGVITGSTASKADTTVVAKADATPEKAAPASVFTTSKPKPVEPKKEIPVIRDTVTAKRPLTVIARKHYGNEFFYVYIYEENKDRISDVNNIAPGTEVIIPLASKYGFDPKDPESIKQAQLKSMQLNKKH